MAVDHIRYDMLTQTALRGVVRKVLSDAAKQGLPGEHHFYISFDTRADGAKLSPRLREQYPQEMTIILQHQFWDLAVHDDAFEVGLSFGGVAEKLVVPFDAIKGFFDPSVQFGLQFETVEDAESEPANESSATAAAPEKSVKSKRLEPAAKKTGDAPPRSAPAANERAPKAVNAADNEPDPDSPKGGAEVVRLDRFRKK
ncbi:MAG: hypothetical protein HY659_06725 [Rhizobiales bacterium]|nr:hypothetical protein [Hyphomicrobiales bacterium]